MVNCRVCKEKLIEGENWYPAFKKGYNDNDLNKYIELKRMVESGKI